MLMLVDSEPKEECYHSLNWVMAGKANQMKWGGVKWASSLHVGVEGHWSTTLTWNAPTYQRGTYTDYRGMVLNPSKQPN